MIRILNRSQVTLDEILTRSNPTTNVTAAVTDIIENVRKHGDSALKAYAKQFDNLKEALVDIIEIKAEPTIC